VYDAFECELDAYASARKRTPPTVELRGLRYPAASTDDVLHFAFAAYLESVCDGVFNLENLLETEETRCRSTKIVLAGSSQGALVVHLALAERNGLADRVPEIPSGPHADS
jgi:hypothetical protein